ncbi:AAA family ATPase [Pseudomonas putida]|uniref:AAA family ATPase n=1 Tax=Pseudomonas putida TaxID=303 RepID=UPI00383AC4A4
MITQIDVNSFGSFNGLVWRTTMRDAGRNVQSFKRLNIIYGRNYSGKTTLSRIFRALETGNLPTNYASPSFTLYGDSGNVAHTSLASHNYEVRVYNRDFVSENLSFLIDQANGEIKTFAIVGELNKEIDEKIATLEAKLGKPETNTGLNHTKAVKQIESNKALLAYSTAKDELESKLRTHANDKIKKNRIYGSANYNIESIRKDITAIQRTGFTPLNPDAWTSKIELLKQEALNDIPELHAPQLQYKKISESCHNLLTSKVTPTSPIKELLDNNALQDWVKQGVNLHKGSRKTCAFCRQNLPHDIWDILTAHFNKESEALETKLNQSIISIETEIDATARIALPTPEEFYSAQRANYEKSLEGLANALKLYTNDLILLKTALEDRKKNLFKPVRPPEPTHNLETIYQYLSSINDTIKKNNSSTNTLDKAKSEAITQLRLSDVHSFIGIIEYRKELDRADQLKTTAEVCSNDLNSLKAEIAQFEKEINDLKSKLQDERKGAERVNAILSHFFGHDGIKLEALDNTESKAIKFEITRDGRSAFNLSEGECSLIAFCYFVAKLEETNTKGKELIVYIDDPISSLDGNHIFFVYSLIESLIARPEKNSDGSNRYRYKQLFISTHNLDFLKYLKKISIPNENNGGNQHFIIERSGSGSNILLMPAYLKNYITEFNYLFHQIYKCRNQDLVHTEHEPFYSFGNNLRKFLEAFLFYKYPHHDDQSNSLERISKFFGNDETAIALANRLNNELSHLESIFDRSIKPVEIPEIPKLANYVLDKIYAADPHQYNSLLKSIGEPERVG